MASTVAGILLTGNHAGRPAANAAGQPIGTLYACSTHSLIYQTDGSTWTTWATLSAGSSGAPTTSTYITVNADASLSAEVPRPELDDKSLSGATLLDFSTAVGDNAAITYAAEADMAGKVTMTDVSTARHCYIASAIGTGDFDIRARIADVIITVPHSAASSPLWGLFLADSSLTVGTRLNIQTQGIGTAGFVNPYLYAIAAGSVVGKDAFLTKAFPIIQRIKRVGTTVTFYFSTNEGRVWQTMGTATSSLNVGRLGIYGTGGSAGSQTTVLLLHWIRSF